jgi:glycine betaine/choline ABC-type transport system substrate-binding protein
MRRIHALLVPARAIEKQVALDAGLRGQAREVRAVKHRHIAGAMLCLCLANAACLGSGCKKTTQSRITIGSKFFTEQVVLAELLAQHIEAKTGIPVIRKTNLGGTLLVHKALLSGDLDLYVEYTGTAVTAVLDEKPQGSARDVYLRVKKLYAERFRF